MQTPSVGGVKTGGFLSDLQAGQHSPGWGTGEVPGGQAGHFTLELQSTRPALQEHWLQGWPGWLQVSP